MSVDPSVSALIARDLDELGLDEGVRVVVQRWLAADRDFNYWFVETTKGKLDDDALFGLLGGYAEDQDAVRAAWVAFREDRDLASLAERLETSIARMASLKHK